MSWSVILLLQVLSLQALAAAPCPRATRQEASSAAKHPVVIPWGLSSGCNRGLIPGWFGQVQQLSAAAWVCLVGCGGCHQDCSVCVNQAAGCERACAGVLMGGGCEGCCCSRRAVVDICSTRACMAGFVARGFVPEEGSAGSFVGVGSAGMCSFCP